jgi:2-hydroxy fatty acid dioxygenase
MIFVPVILITSFQMVRLQIINDRVHTANIHQLTNTPALITLPDALQYKYLPLNGGTIGAIIYALGYILLEPVVGLVSVPLLLGVAAYMNYLTITYGATATSWSVGIHVASWIAQFVGHGAYEGRSPALLDNLFQALFLAPLFVFLEYLFMFGYRPELQRRVEAAVQKKMAQFKAEKSD